MGSGAAARVPGFHRPDIRSPDGRQPAAQHCEVPRVAVEKV